jgi:hypothetical protein
MLILAVKSFLEKPPSASSIFAPIEVPHRRICRYRVNSFLSCDKN